ncbi:MAG: hypothetical protein K2X39_01455 [Silvanigrellaceae bacterium]|nr:hypothetical protein [Silvanigrellaceae bacterium]
MNVICDMVEQTSIKHDRLIKQLTAPLLQSFGISYFCYQFVSNEGDWFTLGNNPDWLLHCAENEFFRFDPSLVRPNYYNRSSICFPKYHQHELFQQTLNGQFIDLFGLDHTLAFIEPTASGCEYYFFAAPRRHCKVLNIYLNQLNRLRFDYTHYLKTHFMG